MPPKRLVLVAMTGLSVLTQPALASPDFTGTYIYQGALRQATISKLEIKNVNGQTRVHVWFYGRPDDVDWGEVQATIYTHESEQPPQLTAELQHGDAKAFLAIRPSYWSQAKVANIDVQSWTRWSQQTEKHQNEFAQDALKIRALHSEAEKPDSMAPSVAKNQNHNIGNYSMGLQHSLKQAWYRAT